MSKPLFYVVIIGLCVSCASPQKEYVEFTNKTTVPVLEDYVKDLENPDELVKEDKESRNNRIIAIKANIKAHKSALEEVSEEVLEEASEEILEE